MNKAKRILIQTIAICLITAIFGYMASSEGNMNKQKPELGQTLYSLNVGNAAHNREKKLTPVTVVKVGRKYFFCAVKGCEQNEWAWTSYYLDTWRQNTDYSATSKLYSNENEYLEEKERDNLFDRIKDNFNYLSDVKKFTLKQLRDINRIIDGKNVKQS